MLSEIEQFLISGLDIEKAWIACPKEINGRPIPYFGTGGTLFIVGEKRLGFIFTMPVGRAVSYNKKLPEFLREFKFPALAILSRPEEIVLVTKLQNYKVAETSFFQQINPKLLLDFLYRPVDAQTAVEKLQIFRAPAIEERVRHSERLMKLLRDASPKNAKALATATKLLGQHISKGVSNEEQDIWVRIATVAAEMLAKAKSDPEVFNKATEALARSIVFLPKDKRHLLVRTLLQMALDKDLTPENTENVASIVLAVAPTLDRAFLFDSISEVRPLIATRTTLPPSLNQLISNYSDIMKRERKRP